MLISLPLRNEIHPSINLSLSVSVSVSVSVSLSLSLSLSVLWSIRGGNEEGREVDFQHFTLSGVSADIVDRLLFVKVIVRLNDCL